MSKEMRKFTLAEMLAARFWFLNNRIKNETIAENIGIRVEEIEKTLKSVEYRQAVERLILSSRTPEKIREWINDWTKVHGDNMPKVFGKRMRLDETVVSEIIERVKIKIA